MIFKREWIWAACGKHPAAKDYLRVGSTGNPLFNLLASWMDGGYQRLHEQRSNQFHSWRFWMKGPKRNALIFGLVKDSSDSLGRPYPFLIAGVGTLKKWEKNWHYLPAVCEPYWERMEVIAAGRYTALKQLVDALEGMKPPTVAWQDLWERNTGTGRPTKPPVDEVIQALSNGGEAIFPLAVAKDGDPFALARRWHLQIAIETPASPNAVFIGGGPNQPSMAVFKSALSPAHFVRLWSE